MNAFRHTGLAGVVRQRVLHRAGLALLLAWIFAALSIGTVHAQTPPAPAADGGICAPTLLPLSGQQARAVNSEPALDNSGSRASFWSTANPQDRNPDGSIEMFAADLTLNESTAVVNSTVAQLTESRGNILGGFNIMPDAASAVLNGSNNAFTVFASDRDLAPSGSTNNADGGFEIFLARRIGNNTVITQLTNTRRSASILPSISNLYPESNPRYANIAFVSDADDKGIIPRGQAGNSNYEVYVMKLDLAVWPPARPDPLLQITQTPNNVNNDKPAMSLLGNAVVFLSDVNGVLRPGATAVANNADRNSEVFRALFTRPDATGVVTFNQVTVTGAAIENDFPDTNADGSQVVFSSTETNFATPATDTGSPAVYVSSVGTGPVTYTPLSASLKANPAHPTIAKEPAINGRGDRIVFAADACDPSAGTCTQPAGQYQVFAADQDIVTKKFLVVQVTSLMTTTHEAPAISGDGRFIALVTSEGSAASNPDLSGSEVAILYCPVARLEPIKTVDTISPSLAEDRPDVGDIVDYVVSLSNGSLTSFDGTMVLTDTLPGQVQWISAAADVPPTGTTISPVTWNSTTGLATWSVDKLPRGQKATVRLRVRILPDYQNAPTGGQVVTNRVNMTTTAPVDEIQSGLVKIATEATADLRVTRVDLSTALKVSTQTPRELTPFFVTLVVTNSLPGALDPATGIRLTTTLPSLLPVYTIEAPAVISGTYNSVTGVWSIPRLDAGKVATLTFKVTPSAGAGGTPARTISIVAPFSDQQDANAANNIIGSASANFRVVGTDLELISKRVNKATPPQFSDVTYTIVLRNNGPTGPLTDVAYLNNKAAFVPNIVEVSDPLPAGLNFASASDGGTLEGGVVVWRIPGWGDGIPAPNNTPTYTVSYTAKVQAAPGTTITNTVSAVTGRLDSAAGPVMPDQNPANNAPASIRAVFTTNQAAAVNLQIRPQPGRIDEGQQVTLTVRYSDPDVLDSHVIAVDWGDGTTIVPSQQPTNAVSTRQVNFLHIYADDNISDTYRIFVTVTDNNGSAAQSNANVTVNNVLPVSTGLTVTQSSAISGTSFVVRVGETLAFRQTFRDPGFTRPPLAETFSYIVDWGDGAVDSSKPVTSVVQGSPGVFTRGTINASHVYATPGTYIVRNTVRDDDQPATGPIGTITVIVTVRPVAVDDLATITEDQFAAVNVIANDTGTSVQLVSVTTPPITGAFALNTATGVITYTAAGRFDALKAGEQRKDFFDYRIRDAFNFTDTGRVTVTVTGVNDAPTVVFTTFPAVLEATATNIRSSFNVGDVDTTGVMSMTATVLHGILNYTGPATILANNARSITVNGTAVQLQAGSLTYTGDTSYFGADTLSVAVNDNDTGPGPLTTRVSAPFTVAGVNDAPTLALDVVPNVNEDTPLSVGGLVTIGDVDAIPSEIATFTATVTSSGRLTVNPAVPAGLTVTGSPSAQVVVKGNLTDINTWLATANALVYQGIPNYNGSETLTVRYRDGSLVAPVNLSAPPASRTFNVVAVNDAPTLALAAVPNASEATPLPIGGYITIGDVDAIASETARFTATVSSNGRLTVNPASPTGLSITGSGTSQVVVTGSLASINTWKGGVNSLVYQGVALYNGSETLTVNYSDGSLVAPVNLSATPVSQGFTVMPVNDAPTLALAPVVGASEDTPLSVGGLVTIGDVDAIPSEIATFTATVSAIGTLTVNALPGGVTQTGSGSSQVVVKGNLTDISNWLATVSALVYQGIANYNGSETLTMRYSDGSLIAPANRSAPPASRTFNVAAVNDAPTLALAPVPDADESAPLSVGQLVTIVDIDAIPAEIATFTATVSAFGTLTVSPLAPTGLTVTGSGSSQVVVKGNLTNVNTWLVSANALVYRAIANYIGSETLTVGYSDGSLVAPANLAATPAARIFSVAAINDPPVISIAPIAVNQNVAVNIHPAINIVDPDSPSSTMRMTVTVASGTLTYSGPLTVGGNGTSRLVVIGTLAQLNDPVNVINYLSPLNAFGTVALTVAVNDGDPAAPGPQTGTASGIITINAAPVLDLNGNGGGTGFSASFTENGGAVGIVNSSNSAAGLTVTDVDSANMLSATVQIIGPLDAGGETLAATPLGGIAVTYNASTGRLVLSNSATKAAYVTVLKTVTYRSTSDNPSPSRTINFQIFDDAPTPLGSALAVATVTIIAVNDAPQVDLNGSAAGTGNSVTFTENGATPLIAPSAVVTDVDNTNLLSATVRIANILNPGFETLAATGSGGVTVGPYNATTGRLTLTGNAPKADYQAVLRTVTYTNTSDNPNTSAARTINVQVYDSGTPPLGSALAVATVTIIAVNDAPQVDLNGSAADTGNSVTFTENGATPLIAPSAVVTDVDNTNLLSATVQIANILNPGFETLAATGSGGVTVGPYNATTGRLTLTGNAPKTAYQAVLRTVTYANTSDNPNTSAARTINVQVYDSGTPPLGSALAVATVTIIAVNDAPTLALAVVPNVNEDTPLSVGGLIAISDADAIPSETAQFTATVTTNGTLVANSVPPTVVVTGSGSRQVVATGSLANINAWKALANALVYRGISNYNGTETLTISYRDGSAVAPANLTATPQNRNFNVQPVDDPPTVTVNTGLAATHAVSPTTTFTDTITAAMLTATDVDTPATGIVFTVITLPPGPGSLRLNNTALAACGTFTQDDIANGRVKYVYSTANVPISAPFPFNVGNAASCAGPGVTFNIAITP